MSTLPHHGSRSTGFAVGSGKKASVNNKLVVTTFADILNSKTLTVSSFEKHSHPSLELMNAFIPKETSPFIRDWRLKQKNAHRLTAYYDVNLKRASGVSASMNSVYSFDTLTCTFGTRYSRNSAKFSYNLGGSRINEADGVEEDSSGDEETINPHACWQYDIQANGSVQVGGYSNLKLPLVLFTVGATSSVIQPGGPQGDRIGIWELVQEPAAPAEPVAFARKKSRTDVRPPVQSTPHFGNRLQHFH
jgi:hypothetical protein